MHRNGRQRTRWTFRSRERKQEGERRTISTLALHDRLSRREPQCSFSSCRCRNVHWWFSANAKHATPQQALQQVTLRHWSSRQPPQLDCRHVVRHANHLIPTSFVVHLLIGRTPTAGLHNCTRLVVATVRLPSRKARSDSCPTQLMMHLLRDSGCRLPSAPVPKHWTQGTDQRYTLVTFQFLNKSKCASTWFKKERDISKDGWPNLSWD